MNPKSSMMMVMRRLMCNDATPLQPLRIRGCGKPEISTGAISHQASESFNPV